MCGLLRDGVTWLLFHIIPYWKTWLQKPCQNQHEKECQKGDKKWPKKLHEKVREKGSWKRCKELGQPTF